MTNDTSGQTLPANWYTDPANPAQLRWWSGIQWTEHTHAPATLQAPATMAVHARVSMSAPAFSAAPVDKPHNGSAWWSLGLGLLSSIFTISVLLHNSTSIIVSTSGVFAIVNGVRALRLVADGRATARIAPIIGIALGGIGTIIMFASLTGVFRA